MSSVYADISCTQTLVKARCPWAGQQLMRCILLAAVRVSVISRFLSLLLYHLIVFWHS